MENTNSTEKKMLERVNRIVGLSKQMDSRRSLLSPKLKLAAKYSQPLLQAKNFSLLTGSLNHVLTWKTGISSVSGSSLNPFVSGSTRDRSPAVWQPLKYVYVGTSPQYWKTRPVTSNETSSLIQSILTEKKMIQFPGDIAQETRRPPVKPVFGSSPVENRAKPSAPPAQKSVQRAPAPNINQEKTIQSKSELTQRPIVLTVNKTAEAKISAPPVKKEDLSDIASQTNQEGLPASIQAPDRKTTTDFRSRIQPPGPDEAKSLSPGIKASANQNKAQSSPQVEGRTQPEIKIKTQPELKHVQKSQKDKPLSIHRKADLKPRESKPVQGKRTPRVEHPESDSVSSPSVRPQAVPDAGIDRPSNQSVDRTDRRDLSRAPVKRESPIAAESIISGQPALISRPEKIEVKEPPLSKIAPKTRADSQTAIPVEKKDSPSADFLEGLPWRFKSGDENRSEQEPRRQTLESTDIESTPEISGFIPASENSAEAIPQDETLKIVQPSSTEQYMPEDQRTEQILKQNNLNQTGEIPLKPFLNKPVFRPLIKPELVRRKKIGNTRFDSMKESENSITPALESPLNENAEDSGFHSIKNEAAPFKYFKQSSREGSPKPVFRKVDSGFTPESSGAGAEPDVISQSSRLKNRSIREPALQLTRTPEKVIARTAAPARAQEQPRTESTQSETRSAGANSNAPAAQPETEEKPPDIDALAHSVYKIIQKRLIRDRERSLGLS
jgi:hypothetical protein